MKWACSQAWCNCRVVSTGVSADAIADYVMPNDSPVALVAMSNLVGSATLHATAFQGGAYRESLISGCVNRVSANQQAFPCCAVTIRSAAWVHVGTLQRICVFGSLCRV